MFNINAKFKSFNFILLGLVFILSVIGIIIVGSATHININGPYGLYTKQKFWVISGFVLLFIFSSIDYHMLSKFYKHIYFINIVLLLATILFGSAMDSGVTRKIGFGNFNIQPSEFAKVFMIIFLAEYCDINKDNINDVKTLGILSLIIIIPVLLIQKQPSLSASLVLVFTAGAIVFISGLNYRYIITALGIIIPMISIILMDVYRETPIFVNKFLSNYQINRILLLLKPDPSSSLYYQTNKSLYALGSGQLIGKGLYNGTVNQLNYLPESHNDFIFSIIGEEFGFIGCFVVLLLELLLVFRCMIIANNADSFNGKLLASGIGSMFLFQTFVHVGVATDILPNTGIALPFISYGGSAIWINMISIGIVNNIYKNSLSKIKF